MAETEKTGITFEIMPPAWSAIAPVMLEAYFNVRRKLYMHRQQLCDIDPATGWCDVHDGEQFIVGATTCDWFDRPQIEQGAWMRDLHKALDDIEKSLHQMARVADMMVERMCRKCGYVGTPDDVHDHVCEK